MGIALNHWLGRRHLLGMGLGLLLVVAASWVTYEVALDGAIRQAEEQAERRLTLFDRTLEAIIERFRYLPVAISQARETRNALDHPDDPAAVEAANGFLSKLNETAGAGEIFLMDEHGSVVAASNWWTLTSLVGTNYSFRPYFADALARGVAQYYAFGISTSVPGYFLSQRVDGPDEPIGVAVTKIHLGELEAIWWRSGELIAIADTNDVAILSTRPDWRYRPLQSLPPARAGTISAEQRYGENGIINEGIVTDRWQSRGAEFAYIAGSDPEASGYFVLEELRLPKLGWRLLSFIPLAPLQGGAFILASVAGLGCAALMLIVVLFEQRRRLVAQRLGDHLRLEQRVAERTEDLHAMNEQLRAEIGERMRAEKAEREAQAGLVQAAKLASLGQALAGVAHEVSQPVAALNTHLASARLLEQRRGGSELTPVIAAMDKVAERLANLTGHLKTFARKETQTIQQADISTVIANALDLVDHRLKQVGVDIDYRRPTPPILAAINPVHCEQVLINLFANAADAMEECPIRVLSIGVGTENGQVRIVVGDTGTGIAPADMATLFDPFFTTKPAGKGLGLGLAISYGLIRDAGGNLSVQSVPDKGTTFTILLPEQAGPTTSFPSPLAGEGARRADERSAISPVRPEARQTPHPSRALRDPPSPARGEGKQAARTDPS